MLIAKEFRRGTAEQEDETTMEPTPPEKRRRVEDPPRDAVAEELRLILDRRGAIAKAAFVPRFYHLISKERRLTQRLTLLTVVRLTQAPLQEHLLSQGLLQVLFRWLHEAKEAERNVTSRLIHAVLEFLMELSLEWLSGGTWLRPHNKDLLEALIASPLDPESRATTERLLERWNAAEVFRLPPALPPRITLENEYCDHKVPTVAHSLHHVPPPVTSSNDAPRGDVASPLIGSIAVVRRVEGLNSPFPRAFNQKLSCTTTVPKRTSRTQKRVRWAPAESLVSIQLFHETDVPIQLFHQSGSGTAAAAAPVVSPLPMSSSTPRPALDIKAHVEWMPPAAVEIKASWRVQQGEESQERVNQTDRERHVVAFDPESVVGDFDPDEPYLEDSIPDPKHRPKAIKLDAKGAPQTSSAPVVPVAVPHQGAMFAVPQGVYFLPGMPGKLH